MIPILRDCIKGKAKFLFFRQEGSELQLWYKCENGFEFPISQSDIKGATWRPEDKAILFMRWIRKHLDWLKSCIEEANGTSKNSEGTV